MWKAFLFFVCVIFKIKRFNAIECEVGNNKATYHTPYNISDLQPSNLSVDGNLNTYSHSRGSNQTTMLRIDLGQEYNVSRIIISNIYLRSNNEISYLNNFNIEVSNTKNLILDNVDLYFYASSNQIVPLSITLIKKKSGRYVYVFKYNYIGYNESLTISEINIYAEFTTLTHAGKECEVASGKSSSQISLSVNHEARFAIDDQLDSYSETGYSSNDINTWLQVDLYQNYLITKVVVSNKNYLTPYSVYLRNFVIFIRKTNETTNETTEGIRSVFGSTNQEIVSNGFSPASPSIVFMKSDGEIGRYVTVVKEGSNFMEPLTIGDLAVFAKIDETSLTTASTTLLTSTIYSSLLPISLTNNGTCESYLLICTNENRGLQKKVEFQEIEKIVIGVVISVLASIIGIVFGFVCGYKCHMKKNPKKVTYETINIQETKPHVYAGIENKATYETFIIQENEPHDYAGIDNKTIEPTDPYENEKQL